MENRRHLLSDDIIIWIFETLLAACMRSGLFLLFLAGALAASMPLGSWIFRICNSASITRILLVQSELHGIRPTPNMPFTISLESWPLLRYKFWTSWQTHSFLRLLHAQRTVTFLVHWPIDGHWPKWQILEHKWGQLGNFLWHGPRHDLISCCSSPLNLL